MLAGHLILIAPIYLLLAQTVDDRTPKKTNALTFSWKQISFKLIIKAPKLQKEI